MPFSDLIRQARAEGRSLLSEVEAKHALHEAGVPVTVTKLAATRAEAEDLADELGYPAVLKIVSADIAHKSDVGGVHLGIADRAAAGEAFDAIIAAVQAAQPGATVTGVSVQRMAAPGTEVIVGMTADPQFGPVMAFGLGGIMVEVLRDVAFRLVPLEAKDAREMIDEIQGRAVLDGVRGQPPADVSALEATLLKVSAFIEANPDVAEVDLNPVIASPEGAVAVDARIVLAEAAS